MMPNKQGMIDYYERLFEEHGYHWRSLDWKDPEGQKARYAVLFAIVSLFSKTKDISILDLGCGLGHFYAYLKDSKLIKNYRINYTGYDISPKLVEAAKQKYPEANFEVKDILEGYFTKRFDFVICSGIFNIILSDLAEHDSFVKEMLKRMYDISLLGVAVNFLSISGISYAASGAREEDSRYYYFKPEDMVNFSRIFSPRFILRQDYHPCDFTMYLIKGKQG